MKQLLAVFLPALLLTGCGSTPESLTEDLIEKTDALVILLEKVVDEESAKEHKAAIESQGQEVKKILQELHALVEELGDEERKEFQKNFKERWGKTAGKLLQQSLRLAFSRYGRDLSVPWDDIKG